MKQKKRHFTLWFLGGIITVLSAWSSMAAADTMYVMKGYILAIEKVSNTVVVEIPLEDDLLTVGGPLSSKAVLKKEKKAAKLDDFKKGEHVTVRWRATDTGHMIEGLWTNSK